MYLTLLYLELFAIAFLGWVIQIGLKLRAIQGKAKDNNLVIPTIGTYFKEDRVSHMLSLGSILLSLFFVSDAGAMPYFDKIWILKLMFAFVGFAGAEFWSKIFSVVNTRVNQASGYKSKIADASTGNEGTPTPAVKPEDLSK